MWLVLSDFQKKMKYLYFVNQRSRRSWRSKRKTKILKYGIRKQHHVGIPRDFSGITLTKMN
jgi:hypothetical protein